METTAAILLATMTLVVLAEPREYDQCYSYESDPYLLMGTKTAYQFVKGTDRLPSIPNCAPVQMWMLARHGTRYPSRKTMSQMQSLDRLRDQIIYNHDRRGNGRLCNPDLEKLRNWQAPMGSHNESIADFLTTPQGYEDMHLLAKRLQSYFPELLRLDPTTVDTQTYKFRGTKSERTMSSMDSFKEGLFNSKYAIPMDEQPYNETLLRLYKNCPIWESSLARDNVDWESERFITINNTPYHELLTNVSIRLGFNYRIKNDSVQLMYDMCRYEKTWTVDRLSTWCSVFTKEEMKVLEYLEDLDYYYYSGPGRDINAMLGCPLVQDMFNHFKELEQGSSGNETKGIFYFGHTITMQTLLAALGIGRDPDPIRADNYHSKQDRNFRTSKLSSFASNLVVIFYRCSDARSPNQVMFYLNEEPLQIEGCQVGLCPWEYLKQRFGGIVNGCSPEFCISPNSSSNLQSHLNLIVLAIFLLGFIRSL
ncbi:multiple inositol polyphosphate phosphatase 1-like [Phymastichus coffea]|uniref:multiple inositol polyphosphate phosphatase 1-like n=1 Tax=Phymastichus coffea TaxID=108790 RepID=UPI00273C7F3C|nr:multiple inositol polyphosphate phosphatase 1-like [Phymastichus coffea]